MPVAMETSSTLEQCKTFKHIWNCFFLIMFQYWRRCSVQLNRNEGLIKKLNYIFLDSPFCAKSLREREHCYLQGWLDIYLGKRKGPPSYCLLLCMYVSVSVLVCVCVCVYTRERERVVMILFIEVHYKNVNST